MSHDVIWTLTLAEPFETESLVVAVRVPGVADEIPLRVEGGAWRGALPGRPASLRVATDVQGRAPVAGASATPADVEAPVESLMADGVALPVADAVRVTVTWAKQCHTGGPAHRNDRFGSREHMRCADRIGEVEGLRLDPRTPLTVGRAALTFGEIIALAGDFYAHLDADAHARFADAWPPSSSLADRLVGGDYRDVTLRDDDPQKVLALAHTIERSEDPASLLDELKQYAGGWHPTRRYLALASQNVCHFGHPRDERNEALRLYRRYHERALALARAAPVADVGCEAFHDALVVEAFGCHFLTDLFASGHIRVPRRALAEGLGPLVGGLVLSKRMHDEDNRLGLWCTTRAERDVPGRTVWRAFGDGFLMTAVGSEHRERVQLAVRAAVRELVEATRGQRPLAMEERAEGLIPAPLPPGRDPWRDGSRVVADNIPLELVGPNHHPLCLPVDRDGEERVFLRVGGVDSAAYRDATAPWSDVFDHAALAV